MMIKKSLKVFFLLSALTFSSCSRTNDNISQDIMIKDFVWGGMNAYYKWQENIPDLADDKFTRQDQLNSYLGGFDSSETLFEKLKDGQDTYSKIIEDYRVLDAVKENPIQVSKIFTKGSEKIGYLLYNEFVSAYDRKLNIEFQKFKNEGVTSLIVDLRNNEGGSIRSAQYLASMITGQYTGDVFCKEEWNSKVSENVKSNFEKKFVEEINYDDINEPINSLKLSKVYFIVAEKTTLASEVLINGLKYHMKDENVILIGSKTKGEQFGTIVLYDSDDYLKNGENFNTSHYYALELIVSEIKNAGDKNESEGFIPDHNLTSDGNDLGEEAEPLLKKALDLITE